VWLASRRENKGTQATWDEWKKRNYARSKGLKKAKIFGEQER